MHASVLELSLPSHFTPCAVNPHRKLAQSSHQFNPLNVWVLKLCDLEYLMSSGLSSDEGVRSNTGFLGALMSMASLLSTFAGDTMGLFVVLKYKYCYNIYQTSVNFSIRFNFNGILA